MSGPGAGEWRVRDAEPGDAAGCAAVYAPYVVDSTASFELEPPDAATMATRIEEAQERHAWLVLVEGPRVVGYAYAGPWRSRPAYRFSCEVSVYLDSGRRGAGGGRLLYSHLLSRVTALGYRTVVAGMTEPNPSSAALHRSMGFTHVGTLQAIGYKFGAWHDVSLFTLHLPEPSS